VSLDEFVHRANDALTRADSLFGSASASRLAADRLADAATTLRGDLASDLLGAAVTGYRTFAEHRAAALQRLAGADAALNRVLAAAATAENAAAAASRSTVAAAAAHVDGLADAAATPGGQRALVAALQSEVGRQQELVRRHQQQAAGLGGQLRQLIYD